jgi:hypothetical protein
MKADFSEGLLPGLARYQIGGSTKNKQAQRRIRAAKATSKYMQIGPNGRTPIPSRSS